MARRHFATINTEVRETSRGSEKRRRQAEGSPNSLSSGRRYELVDFDHELDLVHRDPKCGCDLFRGLTFVVQAQNLATAVQVDRGTQGRQCGELGTLLFQLGHTFSEFSQLVLQLSQTGLEFLLPRIQSSVCPRQLALQRHE